MLKAIHAQEDRPAAEKKATDVVIKLHEMKLSKAAKIVEEGFSETLSYMAFPREHWARVRTNNPLERVASLFQNKTSLLHLATAVLMEIDKKWQTEKRYLPKATMQPA